MSLIFCLLWCCLWWGSSAEFSSFTSLVGLGAPTSAFIRARSIKMSLNQFNIEDSWIIQKLDHFNPNDKRTWKQVLINLSIYDSKTCYNDSVNQMLTV